MKPINSDSIEAEKLKYLKLLARNYPDRDSVATRIINLQAILNLPKGTEHFLSDIHGEEESFFHVLKNGSGVIKKKIEMVFSNELSADEMRELATLVYYPREIVERNRKRVDADLFYQKSLYRLIRLTKVVTSKYTRKKIRKALPESFAYIIEELLHDYDTSNSLYYSEIIRSAIELDRAGAFIVALAEVIQHFSVTHLHIIGDIYDRGDGAVAIMDRLECYHSLDIQWGNHDIVWMGAASGSLACIANAIRVSLRYGNTATLEEGYGISLRPLANLANNYYADDPCERFQPKPTSARSSYTQKEKDELSKMHKAISIIQFKLEAQLLVKNPQWGMEDRTLLERIDLEKGIVEIDGVEHPLIDTYLPTLSATDPFALDAAEEETVEHLKKSFLRSEKLQRHTKMLFDRGAVYTRYNNNLLYHGCIPMDEEGEFMSLSLDGKGSYSGQALLDKCDLYARKGFFSQIPEKKEFGQGVMWYLWAGRNSPLFGKDKMATFESYFIGDKSLSKEKKNPYYDFRYEEEACIRILSEFGLYGNAKIINGHVPVKVKKGESPVKGGGRMLVIDGGFSKAYQGVTGIAGYTLIYDSQGMALVSHVPFTSTEDAIENGTDIVGPMEIVEQPKERILVKQSDIGRKIIAEIEDLHELFALYSEGVIKEQ